MNHSRAETVSHTCSHCGQSLEGEIWVIVNVWERPDLVERIRHGTLHAVICPSCGQTEDIDAPLLLFFPDVPLKLGDRETRLLFSPARGASQAEKEKHARTLLVHLQAALDPALLDEWLAQGLPVVPREMPPLLLSDDPEATMRQAAERAAELERLRREQPEAYRQLEEAARRIVEAMPLLEALWRFIVARTWDESRRILEAHPELLTDEADALLRQLIQAARFQSDENAGRVLEEHQALLRRCREVGIARAFAEKMLPPEALEAVAAAGLTPEEALELARQAAEMPPELQELLAELAASGRIQTLLALQQQAENNPGLWPQVLEGWRALIAEAESAGQRDVSAFAKWNFASGCIRLYELTGDETRAHRAEQLLREVEDVFPRGREPHIWAAVQHSLGTLFYRRYERSGDEAHAQRAEAHFTHALQEYRPESAPADWATVQHALGTLYARRYERSGDEAHAQRAEERYREVVDFHEQRRLPTVFPFRAYRALAHLEFQRGNWRECASAASSAQALLETLLSLQAFRAGKAAWLREAQGLPTWAAFARLRLGEAMQALEALEAGRAQLLREALERSRQDLKRLPELGFGDLHARFARAAAEEERLANLPLGARPPDWTDQLESARRELLKAAEAIRREVGARFPEYRFFLRPLPFEEIRRQAADAPLVYLAATEYGGFALIARAEGEPLAVELPQLTEKALQEQMLGPASDPKLGGYLGAYLLWRGNPHDESARERWLETLEETLRWLGEAAMGPVVAALETFVPPERLVRLIPSGLLALLPLHAALLPAEGEAEGAVYALDRYTFAYVPSAQALYHARLAANRAPARSADYLLAVYYRDRRFQCAVRAVRAALNLFPPEKRRALWEKKRRTRQEDIREAFGNASVLFFFTHGQADFEQPLRSGLQIYDNEWLTLEDIFAIRSERARLAVLAACETGLPSDLRNIEEVVSLPSGLIQAGVPGVVGSLWIVPEVSTALLMVLFFEYWRTHGMSPPHALRRAQQILRDGLKDEDINDLQVFQRYPVLRKAAKKFREKSEKMQPGDFIHPSYWAAFTYTGI